MFANVHDPTKMSKQAKSSIPRDRINNLWPSSIAFSVQFDNLEAVRNSLLAESLRLQLLLPQALYPQSYRHSNTTVHLDPPDLVFCAPVQLGRSCRVIDMLHLNQRHSVYHRQLSPLHCCIRKLIKMTGLALRSRLPCPWHMKLPNSLWFLPENVRENRSQNQRLIAIFVANQLSSHELHALRSAKITSAAIV